MSVNALSDCLEKVELSEDSTTIASSFHSLEVGLSNAFIIDVKPGTRVYRYYVDMIATSGRGQMYQLTGSPDSEGFKKLLSNHDVNINYLMLTEAYEKTGGFGVQNLEIVYDNHTNLFTHCKIHNHVLVIQRNEMNVVLQSLITAVKVEIKIMKSAAHEFVLDDPSHYNVFNNPVINGREDRGLQSFFEIFTSQVAIDNGLIIAKNYLKKTQRPFISGTSFLDGFKKSIRLVRTENNQPQLKLSVDVVTSVFYNASLLSDSLYELSLTLHKDWTSPNVWSLFEKLYANVKVTLLHKMHRLILVKKLSVQPVSQLYFTHEGQNVFVVDYFLDRYGICLRYPDLPALECKIKGLPKPVYYPLEILKIVGGQKVPMSKFNYLDVQNNQNVYQCFLNENIVPPHIRMERITECIRYLKLDSPLFAAFGVKFRCEPRQNMISFGVRNLPTIQMKNATITPDTKSTRFTFNFNKFTDCANFPNVWHFACAWQDSRACNAISRLRAEAIKRGTIFVEPKSVTFDSFNSNPQNWVDFFTYLINEKCEFLMLLDSKTTNSHVYLKHYEAQFGIITQHITIEAVKKLRSFENIYSKTNLKLGGLNYKVSFESSRLAEAYNADKLFILGYDVSHPTDGTYPSVVGVCYNSTKQIHSFNGNFFYQQGLLEAINPNFFVKSICLGLKLRQQTRPDAPTIEMCIVYRDGVSEGQFPMVINHELPAIQQGFEMAGLSAPPIAVIIVSKRHNNRIFSQESRALVKNPNPGVIVQKGLTRYRASEFFLQAANSCRGTARPVSYTVIMNELNLTMDDIQSFTNGLCYAHQIISSAVNIPEPVYQAHELAKRGANNFAVLKSEVSLPKKANVYDYAAINAKYTCLEYSLLERRFTA